MPPLRAGISLFFCCSARSATTDLRCSSPPRSWCYTPSASALGSVGRSESTSSSFARRNRPPPLASIGRTGVLQRHRAASCPRSGRRHVRFRRRNGQAAHSASPNQRNRASRSALSSRTVSSWPPVPGRGWPSPRFPTCPRRRNTRRPVRGVGQSSGPSWCGQRSRGSGRLVGGTWRPHQCRAKRWVSKLRAPRTRRAVRSPAGPSWHWAVRSL
jgi:hypothetical protein